MAALIFLAACNGEPAESNVTENETSENADTGAHELPFRPVTAGNFGAFEEKGFSLIQGGTEWDSLWKSVNEGMESEAAPKLSFGDSLVLAVHLGQRKSGGYGVMVEQIVQIQDTVFIHAVEVSPGKSCITTQATTNPFQVIALSKPKKASDNDLQIRLEFENRVQECE